MALLDRRYLFIHMAAGEVATSRRTLNRYLCSLGFSHHLQRDDTAGA